MLQIGVSEQGNDEIRVMSVGFDSMRGTERKSIEEVSRGLLEAKCEEGVLGGIKTN